MPAEAVPKRAAEKIRETVRELFYREGIRAVGVEEIVSRAGVTKPSLYRAFASKDELAAAYIRDYSRDYFERFGAVLARHPGDPRAQIMDWLGRLQARAATDGYRGCGITNAVVEHPDHAHPARAAAFENKTELRALLTTMAKGMGAREPEVLADGLMLLMEGAYATGQLFGAGGPAQHLTRAAEALIESQVRPLST